MCRGQSPTAEAFVAMRRREERKRGATTLQTTGHDNRAVARYNQMRGGRDQQTNLLEQNATKEQPRGRAGRGRRPCQQESKTTQTQQHKETQNKQDTDGPRQRQKQTRDPIKTKPNEKENTKSKHFFVSGALCLSAGHHFETYSSTTSRSRPRARGESIRG